MIRSLCPSQRSHPWAPRTLVGTGQNLLCLRVLGQMGEWEASGFGQADQTSQNPRENKERK